MIKEIEVRKLPSNKAKKFISKLINQYDKENPKSDLKTKSYQNEYLIYDIVNEDFKSWFWPKVTKDYFQKGLEVLTQEIVSYNWTIQYYNFKGQVKHTLPLTPILKVENNTAKLKIKFAFDPVTINLPEVFPEYDLSIVKIFVKRGKKYKLLEVRKLEFDSFLLKRDKINNLTIDFNPSEEDPISQSKVKKSWIQKLFGWGD